MILQKMPNPDIYLTCVRSYVNLIWVFSIDIANQVYRRGGAENAGKCHSSMYGLS